MLQVLLTILKILGILILVILGIILTVLLLVLFVPLRYRGDVTFDGKPKGGILVSWLLRIITVRIDYDGAALTALVKVLWFKLFEQKLWPEEDTIEEDLISEDLFDADQVEILEHSSKTAAAEKTGTEKLLTEKTLTEKPLTERTAAEKPAVEKTAAKKSAAIPRAVSTEQKVQKREMRPKESKSVSAAEKTPIFEKLYNKISALIIKLAGKLRTTYEKFTTKYEEVQGKIEMIKTFLSDQENQNTIRLIKRQIFRLLKHVLPKKMRGRIQFGFDDPATTGKILTYISPFYGWYAKSVTIEPVFDEKVLEGELHLKGRIRAAALLWFVVRILLNKNFRVQIRKFLKSRK